MGAIQNAINSMIGTAAAATIGVKKFAVAKAEQAKTEQTEKIALTQELPKIEQEIYKGEEKISRAETKLEKSRSGRNSKGQFRSKVDVMREVKAGEFALASLKGIQEAKIMQRDLMQKRYSQLTGVKKQ